MAVVTENLVAEWVARLATGSGQGVNDPLTTTWVDNVGVYDGTLENFAGDTSSGWDGDGTAGDPYGLVFSGGATGDDRVNCGDIGIAEDKVFSIEVWFWHNAGAASTIACCSSTATGTSRNMSKIALAYSSSHYRLYAQLTDNSYNAAAITGSTAIDGGSTIRHGVFTCDGTNLRLYLNGSSDADAVSISAVSGTVAQNVTTMGAQRGDSGYAAHFTGGIYTKRLYSSCLSDAEVLQNYNAGVLAASTDVVATPGKMTLLRGVW